MKVRVKASSLTKDDYMDFAGFTGELQKDGLVIFDEKSRRKIPKKWIKEAKDKGFDPYTYCFNMDCLEVIE